MKKHGFTLIELSIVLVIIGLIVGGVLVGRDLVRGAEVRATISQLEKLTSATNTFRLKYGGLPGDIAPEKALAFGLYTMTYGAYVGHPGYGDENGFIQCGSFNLVTPAISNCVTGETPMFFRHLSEAKLIEGNFGTQLNAAAESWNVQDPTLIFPSAKIGNNTIIDVASPQDGRNYFMLYNLTSTSGAGSHGTSYNSITAIDAYAIDIKMDDGLPGAGGIFAINGALGMDSFATWTSVTGITSCASGGVYIVNPGTALSCSLRVKFRS